MFIGALILSKGKESRELLRLGGSCDEGMRWLCGDSVMYFCALMHGLLPSTHG